ncbi:hypothetical protein OG21DRAFT_1507471 [Imleria badia]|nr:hypothetical protein OG21DRAFT_1507471 [Imleria badia]
MAPKRSRDESASARLLRTEKTSADCFTATLAAHPILVLRIHHPAHARLESARRLAHQPLCLSQLHPRSSSILYRR